MSFRQSFILKEMVGNMGKIYFRAFCDFRETCILICESGKKIQSFADIILTIAGKCVPLQPKLNSTIA